MSHFVAYILQFQEIIVYKIPPGGGGGSIASLRSNRGQMAFYALTYARSLYFLFWTFYLLRNILKWDVATIALSHLISGYCTDRGNKCRKS